MLYFSFDTSIITCELRSKLINDFKYKILSLFMKNYVNKIKTYVSIRISCDCSDLCFQTTIINLSKLTRTYKISPDSTLKDPTQSKFILNLPFSKGGDVMLPFNLHNLPFIKGGDVILPLHVLRSALTTQNGTSVI